jgi:hypothetical protein
MKSRTQRREQMKKLVTGGRAMSGRVVSSNPMEIQISVPNPMIVNLQIVGGTLIQIPMNQWKEWAAFVDESVINITQIQEDKSNGS